MKMTWIFLAHSWIKIRHWFWYHA